MRSSVIALLMGACVAGPVLAGPPGTVSTGEGNGAATLKLKLTPQERAQYAAQIVRRFEPDVRVKGGNVGLWARKLGQAIGLADAVNVQNAARMPSLDTMMAVLTGQSVESPSVQAALNDFASGAITPASLGSTIADTVYTPLPNGRCRVADSRVIASPLPGATARNIDVEDTASYASQGGNGSSAGDGSTNCGIPSFATALAVSVTVLTVGNEGFFKIYANGDAFTTGNTVFYMPAVSASNDVIVKSCQACALELAVYSSSPVHYVIDVVGYFMPPVATALQCVDTAETIVSVAAGATANATAPACASGYTQTATNCESSTWQMPFVYFSGGTCSAQNNSAGSASLRASRTCCRVPGR